MFTLDHNNSSVNTQTQTHIQTNTQTQNKKPNFNLAFLSNLRSGKSGEWSHNFCIV